MVAKTTATPKDNQIGDCYHAEFIASECLKKGILRLHQYIMNLNESSGQME